MPRWKTQSKTGVWLGEFTDPYYELINEGYQVTLSSPKGGEPPIDPMSKMTEHITGTNRRFLDDEIAQQKFRSTLKLENINVAEFDGYFSLVDMARFGTWPIMKRAVE